eukprot:gene992-10767_t
MAPYNIVNRKRMAIDAEAKIIREKWIAIIERNREQDPSFKEQKARNSLHICELHFAPEDIEHSVDRKKVRFGSLPSQNLPKKSFEKDAEPSFLQIEKREKQEVPLSKPKRACKSFDLFSESVAKLKLNGWDRKLNDSSYIFERKEKGFIASKIKVNVDESLDFAVTIFGLSFPDDHYIYKKYKRNVRIHSIASLLQELLKLTVCEGVDKFHDGLNRHSVAREIDLFENNFQGGNEAQDHSKDYFRSMNCKLLSEKATYENCIPAQPRKKRTKKTCPQLKLKPQFQEQGQRN